jgi:hypothetical protein
MFAHTKSPRHRRGFFLQSIHFNPLLTKNGKQLLFFKLIPSTSFQLRINHARFNTSLVSGNGSQSGISSGMALKGSAIGWNFDVDGVYGNEYSLIISLLETQ